MVNQRRVNNNHKVMTNYKFSAMLLSNFMPTEKSSLRWYAELARVDIGSCHLYRKVKDYSNHQSSLDMDQPRKCQDPPRPPPPRGGGNPREIGRECAARFPNPYPIYDQNLRYSLPYLRPDHKFETLFMTWHLNQNPVSDLGYN